VLSHFRVEVDGGAGIAVVKPHGELDLASAGMLRDALEQVAAVERVIIDLSGLEFIDSTGIGVLVAAHQHATDEGRSLAVVKGTGQVAQLLELTGLSQQLSVSDTLAELLGT
jgi:anti-sigma B factor antagonist